MAMAIRRVVVYAALVLVALFQLARTLFPASDIGFSSAPSHPIPNLMASAEAKYRKLVGKQSATLEAAVAEYKRRYKRDPPKGFDDWIAFAKDNDVKIIDEYDSMMGDLEPFWALSGEEIRRRAQQVRKVYFRRETTRPTLAQVGQLPSIDLVRLENGKTTTLNIPKKFNDSEGNARSKGFRVMIEKFQDKVRSQ
jgi:hypothetical protein